jgi:hypothetical protein
MRFLLELRQRLDQAAICADSDGAQAGTRCKNYGYDNNNDILGMPSIHRISYIYNIIIISL